MKYFVFVFCFFLFGCPTLDIDFFVGDYEKEQIINEDGSAISCTDPKFNTYGCLDEKDIAKLKRYIDTHCKK